MNQYCKIFKNPKNIYPKNKRKRFSPLTSKNINNIFGLTFNIYELDRKA